jgi:serine/threonine protein kinase
MDVKRCPYCGEEILAVAIKCKHCGSGLAPESLVAEQDPTTAIRLALAERYEVVAELGHGGNATVFQAIQKNLDRKIALKVLHPQLSTDREFIDRFHQEARAIASLHHPNIVTIYDEGVVNGVHFMAMEFLDGPDLHRVLEQRGRLPVQEVVKLTAEVAGALDFAHTHGVIHRDVKSSNIILKQDRGAVLTDFGIAHAGFGAPLTATGTVLGTPEFMSPEQADGMPVDERTDFFSLGVVMYNALTGTFPFRGANPLSTIYKILHEPHVPVGKLAAVPPWMELAVDRCLVKDRDARIRKGSELVAALGVGHDKTLRFPPGAVPPAVRTPRPMWTIGLLAVCIVLCSIVLVQLLWPPGETEPVPPPDIPPPTQKSVQTHTPRQIPDVRGKTVEEAIRLLREAGFTVESIDPMNDPDPAHNGKIDSQLPVAGTEARQGTAISLMVAQLPAGAHAP